MGTGEIFYLEVMQSEKLAIHLHLVAKLRIYGTLSLSLLHLLGRVPGLFLN